MPSPGSGDHIADAPVAALCCCRSSQISVEWTNGTNVDCRVQLVNFVPPGLKPHAEEMFAVRFDFRYGGVPLSHVASGVAFRPSSETPR